MFRYFPEQGSDYAATVDNVNHLVTDLSVFFTVVIVGAMIYFAIRYRRRNGVDHETPMIHGSTFLEIVWTVVPAIICVIVAWAGYVGYDRIRTLPPGEDTVDINVWGQQWAWSFEYPNGKKTTGEFVVPVGKPIKLVMSSRDVTHSFFIPTMRAKMDVVPGRFTTQWFRPIVTGPQVVFCTEYCGTSHSNMMATMRVVPEGEYLAWLNDKGEALSPAEEGKALYTQNACNSCHSLDGSRVVGPSFLKLFGREAKFSDGVAYVANEDYIRESILYPNNKVVEGYGPPSAMPAYEGRISDEEISKIIAFIKTLKEAAPKVVKPAVDTASLKPEDRGKTLYQQKACIGCHTLDGSAGVGPSFKGLWERAAEFDDGTAYVVDEAYIKGSILEPQKQVVKGYPKPSPMPPYQGQLTDADLNDLIAFIKTLK